MHTAHKTQVINQLGIFNCEETRARVACDANSCVETALPT